MTEKDRNSSASSVKLKEIGRGIFCAVLAATTCPPKIHAQSVDTKEIVDKAIARVQVHSDWDNINIKEAEGRHYWVYIYYKDSETSIDEVEADTRQVADIIFDEVKRAGIDPRESKADIHVTGEGPPRLITGAMRTHIHGTTYFAYSVGEFKFEAVK